MKTNLRSAVVLLATLCPPALHAQASGLIGAVGIWGVQTDTPAWNQELGVVYSRQGCPDAPSSCMSFTGRVAAANNVKVSLAIPLNPATPAAAADYSRLSATAPFLAEVTIDDFVSQYKALGSSVASPASVVAAVIANLKSANPRLKFGATVYEDDLSNVYLQDARLPAAVRQGFDVVHLFLHYREDGPKFTTYVQAAKRAFPNAVVIAGSYAVDRRAFLPCSPGGLPCTTEQDYDLFTQTFTLQVQLMRHGAVSAIEFFPGYFGNEEQWPSLSNPRECPPGEVTECIANTKRMRQFVLGALHQTSGVPVWTEPFPTGPLPAPRYGQSAAMDSANDRMIMFGGTSDTKDLNDTWILTHADGKGGQPAWLPVTTATAPPTGSYSQGMYDPNSNRMILYGGTLGNDIWVLTNANGLGSGQPAWTQVFPIGNVPPTLTDYEKLAYDPISNVLIAYDSTAGVWTLSNANGLGGTPRWNQLNAPADGPSARTAFTAVYNPSTNRMIVFGGSDGATDFNDLWVLANANGLGGAPSWIPLPTGTANVPAGREGHVAVYDAANDAMTIFGGIGLDSATWTAANASGLNAPPVWTMVNSGAGLGDPPTDCSAVFDTNSLSMIVFGGYNTAILNAVMVLSPLL